jgi:lactose/L-arabinose transport system substrate-binding protein
MSNKRSFNMLAVTLGMTLSVLPAISHAADKQLTVWAWDPNFNISIMEKAKEIYAKEHPDVKIKVEDFAKPDLEQKMHTVLASGMTDSLPDIVLIEDYNAQKFLTSYPDAFSPMDGVVDYKEFSPYKTQLMTVNGHTYGMPFDSGVTGLYYRRDIIAAAGIKPEELNNITWDRFIELGKQVKAKTGKAMLSDDPSDPNMVRILMQSAGTWYFKPDGSLNIKDNAALKEALRLQKAMVDAGITTPSVGWSGRVSAANKGDVATVTNGVWFIPSIKAAADQAGKWGVAPTPRLNIAGGSNYSNSGGSSWYALSASPNSKLAIDFLNSTFSKDVGFYQRILTENGAVGTFLKARTGAAYQTPDSFFGGQKIYSDFATWLAKVPEVSYGQYTYEADAVIAALLPSLYQGTPIDDVVAQIDQQLASQIQP